MFSFMFAHDCRDKGDSKGKRPVDGDKPRVGRHALIRALAIAHGEQHLLPPSFGVAATQSNKAGLAHLAEVLARISKPEPEDRMK